MFIKCIKIKKNRRIGRGESSKGKTCGRGHKGQKSRAGSKKYYNFEGGTLKQIKKHSKFGFNKIIKNNNKLNLLFLNKIPLTLFSIYTLKKIQFIKKKIFYLKIFSNYFYLKNIIFYNIILSKISIFLFINLNFYFIF
ncbi:50S ribosomal subunit protein L15 [Candidatus Nasuia deltocephalinicola str. NAS-ALF]|uniref:50S ribosomal protein L15 n=1 Tax=Candidatus Nasuia deltocephalinicola str. NAS-ALF TaxID=1343077 RepID=S5SQC5_9PROT|nr:50S ribosomal subunit protein L15 [Candidatus Nasuia deltocephalinicola str. NAS-ALF]